MRHPLRIFSLFGQKQGDLEIVTKRGLVGLLITIPGMPPMRGECSPEIAAEIAANLTAAVVDAQ